MSQDSNEQRIVFGVRPVEELVRARPRDVSVVYVADGTARPRLNGSFRRPRSGHRGRIPPAPDGGRAGGRRRSPGAGGGHRAVRYVTIDDILAVATAAKEPPLVVLLDGITDPHNLGAIVRSAEVLGAHGVVIPARGAAPVTPGAVKASAGATERVRIAEVDNLMRDHRLPARDAACACWAPAPARASGSTRSTSPVRSGWSWARRGRACARRWRVAATAFPHPAARRGLVAQRLGRRRHRALRSGAPAAPA